jgi:hypothetical protein
MYKRHITDEQQVLASLAREAQARRHETSAVVSGNAGSVVWPMKVKSHVDRNVYRVRAVVLGEGGGIPPEIGEEIEATNLAESFVGQGALPAGTYVIAFRTGPQYIFHAQPV